MHTCRQQMIDFGSERFRPSLSLFFGGNRCEAKKNIGQLATLHNLRNGVFFFAVRRIYARRLGCITDLHPMVVFLSKSPFEFVG